MRNPCTDPAAQRWMPWAQPVLLKECADPLVPIQESVVGTGDTPPNSALVIEMTEDEDGFVVVGQPGDHRPGTDDAGWTSLSTVGVPVTPDDGEGEEEDEGGDGIVIVLSHDLPERQHSRPAASPLIRELGVKEVAHG